jgi:hypothetical protein
MVIESCKRPLDSPAIELEAIDFTTLDWDFVLKAMYVAL